MFVRTCLGKAHLNVKRGFKCKNTVVNVLTSLLLDILDAWLFCNEKKRKKLLTS